MDWIEVETALPKEELNDRQFSHEAVQRIRFKSWIKGEPPGPDREMPRRGISIHPAGTDLKK